MVHFTDTVVTLKDLASGRPFREFDHHRASSTSTVTVKMPFDTEYGITLKTMDYGRRRMEVTIDGAQVADLIFQGGPGFQQTLERFLDSAKRFKFVKATSEAVADPTNPSNGDIVVKVWRENAPQSVPICAAPRDHHRVGLCGGVLRGMGQKQFYGDQATPTSGGSIGATVEGSKYVNYCAESLQVSSLQASHAPTTGFMEESGPEVLSLNACVQQQSDRGATVEGGASDQQFGHTTWGGDLGLPSVFVFKLRAPVAATITSVHCTQCGFAAGPHARFCAACGSPLAFLVHNP